MKKILIVEDEDDIARVMQLKLQQEGYHVLRVIDGIQAVTAIHKQHPDLMILDLMLPGGDGLSVLKKIKQSFKTNNIPIIILTSMQNQEYKDKVLALGVEAYLNKPYDAAELIAKIKGLIG